MSFSPQWEDLYANGVHRSVWPWSELVTLVLRHARPQDRERRLRVLELGCGQGANVPFVLSFGGEYHGVDGSPTALADLDSRFPGQLQLATGDFCRALPFDGPFDVVIDRASLTHNDTPGIRSGLKLARDVLAPDGLFFGVHWFSTVADEYAQGCATNDPYVRSGYTDGRLAGTGVVHFSDRAHITDLFTGWDVLSLTHCTQDEHVPTASSFGWWNIVARPSPGQDGRGGAR